MENKEVIRIIPEEDPFCYPGTKVLKNRFGIKEQEKLNEYEKHITDIELFEMLDEKVWGRFDKEHYIKIHKRLFENIYYPEVVGKIRNYNLMKGKTCFCLGDYVETYLDKTLIEMKKSMLKIKDREDYVNKLTYYHSELNMIHPFREGNGRTLREFLRQYVSCLNSYYDFQYELDCSKMDNINYINNIRHDKTINLREEFDKALVSLNQEPKVYKKRY